MKYDMPDKPGLLEASYFWSFWFFFFSAILPFNKTRCWSQVLCSTLVSPADIRKPHTVCFGPYLWYSTYLGNLGPFLLRLQLDAAREDRRRKSRLICISKWCACLLAKVFLHASLCDLLTVSRSFCCLWLNGVIKHNVSISHIATTTRLYIESQSVRATLSRQFERPHDFSACHTGKLRD